VKLNCELKDDGTLEIWHTVNDGGFVVRGKADMYFNLYEIPLFGGEERHVGVFSDLHEAIAIGLSWT